MKLLHAFGQTLERIIMIDINKIKKLVLSKPKHETIAQAMKAVTIRGDFAEFGTLRGKSARAIQKYISDNKLYCFDTFTGLPEYWRPGFDAGKFGINEKDIPSFNDDRVIIMKGLFKDTIPEYNAMTSEQLSFIHIDCDLYSSTMDALLGCNDKIVSGTVLLFDEFMNFENWDKPEVGEYAALNDWIALEKVTVKPLWINQDQQAAFIVE